MQSSYVIWTYRRVEHACVLNRLEGVDRQFELMRGVTRATSFPPDAFYTMDPEYPNHLVMPDNLNNIDRLVVASHGLKDFLEARSVVQVEYLPIAIRNHKGRDLPEPYYIVHPVDPVDCLEVDQCGAVWGHVAKDKIKIIKQLVIDEGRIDPARELFRLKLFYQLILVRRDLAEAIDAAGFTGIRWVETKDYPH